MTLRRFARDDSGATAIEYALIASGISIAIVGTIVNLGSIVSKVLHERFHGAEIIR
jgi:pilus assembly protein Flp/PilA